MEIILLGVGFIVGILIVRFFIECILWIWRGLWWSIWNFNNQQGYLKCGEYFRRIHNYLTHKKYVIKIKGYEPWHDKEHLTKMHKSFGEIKDYALDILSDFDDRKFVKNENELKERLSKVRDMINNDKNSSFLLQIIRMPKFDKPSKLSSTVEEVYWEDKK